MISVSGLTWARRHKREFDAVLSIEDPRSYSKGLAFHHNPHPAHLVLRFYDLDYPIPEPHHRAWMQLATHDDVTAAIRFAQTHPNLLVHCRAGVSRSPAIALAILTDRGHDPQQALTTLLQLRPLAVPNRHITMLADEVLGSGGNLLATLDAWDHSIPNNAVRRRLGRVAHLYEFGIPLTL